MGANNGAEMGDTQKYYGAQLGHHIGPTNWSPPVLFYCGNTVIENWALLINFFPVDFSG